MAFHWGLSAHDQNLGYRVGIGEQQAAAWSQRGTTLQSENVERGSRASRSYARPAGTLLVGAVPQCVARRITAGVRLRLDLCRVIRQ